MAIAVEELGKDMASQYFKEYNNLMKKYSQDDPMGEYNYYFTSCNYYMKTKDFRKAANYCDSIIHYLKYGPLSATLSDNVIQILSDKTNCLDSLHDYKGAYETYKQYVSLLDSARIKSMQTKVNDLEIKKQVDQIAVEKKALELDLQKSHITLYMFMTLFILSVAVAVYVFFKLGKIKSLYKDLQDTNDLLNKAQKRAEESEQMKNSFIKNMCHEVRTPLNAINGFAELISDEGINAEEKKEFSKIIFANCNDITSMMNNVLVISEMDNSHSMFELSPTHVDMVCQYEMEKLKKLKAKASILYSIEGDKNNDLVLSAQNQLSVIIAHLLDNANKFTETGEIILSYQHDEMEKRMLISISDTGCGIPADKSEWIFERFTKNNDFIPGSGLGLSMCKLIAQHLDGSLTLDKNYKEGARFILSLPLPEK
jgi:signal transduction histidine kinase